MKRLFEWADSPSSKFWEVWRDDSTVYTRFGKAGTYGQVTTKRFETADDAKKALDDYVSQKLEKGFVEIASSSASTQAPDSWASILSRLLEDFTSVSADEARSCLVGVLRNEHISWEPYGEAQALAHRIVWEFPDSDETVVWVTREGDTFISQRDTEFDDSSEWPWDHWGNLESDCVFIKDSNAWKFEQEVDVSRLLETISLDAGEPLMILPWESIATQKAEELQEFLDEHVVGAEDDEGTRHTDELLFTLYSQVADMSLELPDDLGEFGYGYGDGFFPRYSKVGRFTAFLAELEGTHGWGVVYDECCGTCSAGTLRDLRSEEGMEDAFFFITWAQNAELTWGTGGWVSHMAYHPDESERRVAMDVARAHGLTVVEGEEGGKKDGFLYIS